MDPARARELLGVVSGAGPDEIRRAYRRDAARHHPDHGGDPARFSAGREAYDVLTANASTRARRASTGSFVFERRARRRRRAGDRFRAVLGRVPVIRVVTGGDRADDGQLRRPRVR